ncbi:hypothetical protein TVAG_359420 [Trichomonas vaginalis G3]|uniref:Right handed beta helix domain-containing protein n=1 Tax=Trichomonas vaginalis (strain ATCC PRA-98 / G3) TaxID=412133 RepID=A2DT62_TRIV3|nr:pectin lyase-like family [Trichomonas vaginalis G3]EAY16334.1 hypothetical protein TVAG_359420 [Trichomonas vaginalis G3]KAI5488440.1 pectin lyase-like family [Trichomonas vaginalis G3]|eukprot:XP_001328557.1 hypothetical protein [Trichomonas vaginalis G3]
MLNFLLCFGQSKNLTFYTSINASQNAKCSIDNPCSYKSVILKAKQYDHVIFNDTYILQNVDLLEFQFTINTLIENSVKVSGSDQITIINGTFLKPKTDYFVIAREGCKLFYFANFEFTGFKHPVMVVNGVEFANMKNVTFKKNMLDNNFCIALWTVSYLNISNVKFSENAVNYTAVLFISTAVIMGDNFIFERNYGEHLGHDCLLRLLNGYLLVDNIIIRDNSANDAPLTYLDCRTGVLFSNLTLERNYHPELFLCDGKCNFSFIDCKIQGNRGVILETTGEAYAELVNTSLINNFSPDEPLFYLPNGTFGFENDSMIIGNHGKSFIDMPDEKSQIYIINSTFESNSWDSYAFGCGYNGNITIRNTSVHSDFSKFSTFNVETGLIDLDNFTSIYNYNSLVNITSGNLTVLNSNFTDEKEIELFFTENVTYVGINNTFAGIFYQEESHISKNMTNILQEQKDSPISTEL